MSDPRMRIYLSLGLTILLINLVSLNTLQKTTADFTPVHITSDVIQFEFVQKTEAAEAGESNKATETSELTMPTEATESIETTESTEPTGGGL